MARYRACSISAQPTNCGAGLPCPKAASIQPDWIPIVYIYANPVVKIMPVI